MPRGRGNTGRRGGLGGARRSGRVSKPRCAICSCCATGKAEAIEPIPGPSAEPSRPKSLMEQLKGSKVVKAMDAKYLDKLSPSIQAYKKRPEELRQQKQVGNFRMPDAPEPKKGKGKGKGKKANYEEEETQVWGPCPLLPGVPTVPPPHVPQRWELQCLHDITKEEEEDVVTEGTPPDIKIPQQLFAQDMLSAGTPQRTAAESDMDIIDATEAMSPCPPLIVIPWFSTAESVPTAKKNRKIHATFTPSPWTVQSTVALENVVPAEIEFLGFTPSSTTFTATPDSGRSTYEFNITEEEEDVVTEGTPPDIKIPQQLFAQDMLSAGTPPRTAASSPTTSTATPDSRRSAYEFNITEEEEDVVTEGTPPDINQLFAQDMLSAGTPPRTATSSPTTSTAAPDCGRSAYEFNVDIDSERDFVEPGKSSDVDNKKYLPNISFSLDPIVDPSLVEALRSIDAEADSALRTVLDPGLDQDLLSFDWRCEPEYFQGVREVFNVPSPGPTFKNADLSPLEVFLKIWDADIIAHIVQATNRYGAELVGRNMKPNSRLHRWKNVTDGEIKLFFAIIMLQSLIVNNVEREYWYPRSEEFRIGNFGAIMSFNRFLDIKRCLHFTDNASLPKHPNRLDKIRPIIDRLNDKFSSLYLLEQNIAIDESLLLWKGRLSFSQKIATKRAKVGIKSYELCESRTGYLWRMEVYTGKSHVHGAQVGLQEPVEKHEEGVEPESATSQIVLNLMRPLFNRGHTLVMDNFYNAPLLSRILKVKYKTDSMGTLRLNREFVPEGLRKKTKQNMKVGEVAFSSTKDLSVVVWRDKSVVAMISTYHHVNVGGIEKYGNYKYKPQVVLDYNLSMGGVDHKDQMLQAYPIERLRNIIWYKKLFRRLLNVSIHNAFVMFNHNRTPVLGYREFRQQLMEELLKTYRPPALPRLPTPPPVAPSQMHLPAKNKKPQRCKLCYAAKVRRTTVWRCSTCAVNLCIERCYTDYHSRSIEHSLSIED